MKRVELGRCERGRRTASALRRAVAIMALTTAALVAVVAQAQAATFTVGSTSDSGGCASPPAGTTCTLRQLVNSVPAGSTIAVPAGTYTLTTGELLIEQNLTIKGAGARTTTVEQNPPAGGSARVFDIQRDPASGATPTVTISGLELLFGKTTSSSPNANAGGNVLNEGTLTLSEDDIVLGETTGGEGAGVANIGGTLTITHSLVEDNLSFASSGSGGISGGIDNVASGATTATVTVDNSTLAGNTAQGGAGGIGNRCIRCTSSTVTVVDSTIFNNDGGTATTNAGGLLAGSGSGISVRNSIVASNTVGSGATQSNCAGSISSLGHDIETSTDCGFKTASDLQNTDPKFLSAGVADMGGNTDTIPLSAASPAVDAVPTGTTGCSGTDQRDVARPQGASCDIGAYELVEPVEGKSFSEVVGNIDGTAATIDWGDGTAQSNGAVDPTTREVTGTHTYSEAGIYHGTMHWTNSDGLPSSRGFDVKVTDAALSATATPISAVIATSFNGTLATFTDANPLSQASDFTATIDWGDGTATSAGTVTTNASGGFKVTGTHTYSKTGSFATTITINDVGGSSASASGTATVSPPRPTVTSVSPSSGPTAGGTSVTITGTNLASATAVKFGTNAATIMSNTATQIVARNPTGSAGTVDVTVTNSGGTSVTSAADHYTYAAPPTVSGISPASGPTLGGTTVTITGTNLGNPSAVKFGGTNAAIVTPISPTQVIAVSPAGSAGAQDVRVTTPGGTSATSSGDRFTFVAPPTVTGVSPSSGPAAGATSVTITGSDFTGAGAVHFGATPAASFSVVGPTQITATSPAGSGVADVTVTTPNGTSSINAADRFTYNPSTITAPPGSPMVATGAPSVNSSSGAALQGSVNPQGLPTTAHYDYGLDSKFRTSGPVYDQSTPSQNVGSDFTSHTVTAALSGLVPKALYHVRLVATNSAGTTFGPDATFTTKADPPPPPPKLGGSFNAEPITGLVFVEINGKFVPITEVRQIPNGAVINALHGTLVLVTAAGGSSSAKVSRAARTKHKVKVATQKGTFGGAVFKVTQDHSGLATLSLVEGASFPGAPTYASCKTHSGKATVAAVSKRTLQLLHGSDNHGKFRTKGRYAAATVRGTVWSIADRCDGTLTHVTRGTVVVSDLVRHKTITVHGGHSYLALARSPRRK